MMLLTSSESEQLFLKDNEEGVCVVEEYYLPNNK